MKITIAMPTWNSEIPMMAGLIGQLSLRSVFLTTGAAYLVALATAALPMLGRATAHEAEPEVDAAG